MDSVALGSHGARRGGLCCAELALRKPGPARTAPVSGCGAERSSQGAASRTRAFSLLLSAWNTRFTSHVRRMGMKSGSIGTGGRPRSSGAVRKGGRRVSFTLRPALFPPRSGAMTPFPRRAGAAAHPKVTRRPPFPPGRRPRCGPAELLPRRPPVRPRGAPSPASPGAAAQTRCATGPGSGHPPYRPQEGSGRAPTGALTGRPRAGGVSGEDGDEPAIRSTRTDFQTGPGSR